MRSVCALLVLAALSPASALRPATLNGRRAPASAAIDRRALLGAAVFAVAAPRSAHAALRGDEDPVIRDVQNLLEFEEIKKNGVEGLTPTASVKVGGLKGDIKVELNVDANGDQKYLWFTDAATRQVLKAKIVQGAKDRGSFSARLPRGITVIPTQYSKANGVVEGAPLLVELQ